jgi:hypothetical protein
MEQRSIKIDRLMGPMNQLLEICLGRLSVQKASLETALALTRLHSLAVSLVVHGYIQHRNISIRALTSNLRDAEQHLHEASAYVTQVYERDRRRLSHDLHDEIGPDLMLLKLYLEMLVLDTEKPEFRALKTEGGGRLGPYKSHDTVAAQDHTGFGPRGSGRAGARGGLESLRTAVFFGDGNQGRGKGQIPC